MDFKLKLIKKYIKHTEIDNILPSVEDCIVWLIKYKSYEYNTASTLVGEYKGYINTFAISYLKNKASAGGRNSQVYIQLLGQLQDDLSTSSMENFEPVNIVVDIEDNRKVEEKVETNEVE